jgi:hypothetical protein
MVLPSYHGDRHAAFVVGPVITGKLLHLVGVNCEYWGFDKVCFHGGGPCVYVMNGKCATIDPL